MKARNVLHFLVGLSVFGATVEAQSVGTVSGTVIADANGRAMHAARVILSPLGRSTDTDEGGKYEFQNVPPGTYDVLAASPGLTSDRVTVQLAAGATAKADFHLRLAPVKDSVTVTATGKEEVVTNALQSVAVVDLTQHPIRNSASLGEVLESETGIAKRSSGPGNGRPVIRGFDGDRVLMLEDGVRTGTLSYQSGDHGEPVDVNQLERIEVVRGPATLLYGSSAVGGVVNVISRHDLHQHPDQALVLSGIGIYGVMSYLVGQRTREMGIRLALGATPAGIRSLLVGRGLILSSIGLAIGLAGAILLGRLLAHLAHSISLADPAELRQHTRAAPGSYRCRMRGTGMACLACARSSTNERPCVPMLPIVTAAMIDISRIPRT